MRILVDADGCPVVDIAVQAAQRYSIECKLICDTAHYFNREGAETVTVSKGADSADYAIVNMLEKNDIVVTQDYGLAAMVLARLGFPITQNGLVINESNVGSLLSQRHAAKKIRAAGGRLRGPKKREKVLDDRFKAALNSLIEECICK